MRPRELGWPALALLTSIALVPLGCLSPRPQYTKHYGSAIYDPDLSQPATADERGEVTLTAFVAPVGAPPPGGKQITDLAEEAQGRLVVELAKLLAPGAKPADLSRALAEPIRPAPSAAAEIDLTRFKRRIVLSVDAPFWPPAYRMERNEFVLSLEGQPADFTGWDRIATEYDRVDLGDLTFSQANKVSFGVELAPPQIQEVAEATVGGEVSRSLAEVLELSRRYRVISGALTPERATLVRQGALGIDLAGNTVVEMELKVDGASTLLHTFAGLKTDKEWQTGDKVRLERTRVMRPRSSCSAITSTVGLSYVLRTVKQGGETYVESDDDVVFRRRFVNLDHPLELIDRNALRFVAFGLRDWRTGAAVQIETSQSPQALQFRTHESALEFLDWLKERKGDRVGGRELLLGGAKIGTGTSLVDLQVAQTNANDRRCGDPPPDPATEPTPVDHDAAPEPVTPAPAAPATTGTGTAAAAPPPASPR